MITVIGSINMDLVVQTAIFPQQGETVLGSQFHTVPGGKGANQAVAAGRLGSAVQMIATVGKDGFGDELIKNLNDNNVDTNNVFRSSTSATGIANILLNNNDNRIIVIPGANYELDVEKIKSIDETIAKSDLIILQLEIPIETVEYVINRCQTLGIPVLLNPAPAAGFKKEWMDKITYLTPNETECELIFGANMEQALRTYPNKLIVTVGRDGARYYDGKQIIEVKGYVTTPVDTTGAGDTFNGALAHGIVSGKSLAEAIQYANIAASLSIEQFGAQGGMPSDLAVVNRLGEMKA